MFSAKTLKGIFARVLHMLALGQTVSNWTERSTIQGVIGRVISKSAQREVRGRFEIMSPITP